MKRKISAIAIPCALMIIAGVSVCSEDSVKIRQEKAMSPSLTMTPEIPDRISFCGEQIDVTRYNMHEGIDRELTTFSYSHATTLLNIKRANRYFPIIEPILKQYGIPDDFKYLAVIESNLNPRITSPARAKGMWQFMESTGKEYGLTITATVDERCNVEKSTVAACKYLKAAYNKYGDWVSVASSYNAGMGRISGELNKQDVDSSLDLWLVEETTRYVYRILAIKTIFENPYKFGFAIRACDLYKPIECQELKISQDINDLVDFAKKHNVTYADIKRLNPWLTDRKLITAGKSYILKIPKGRSVYYDKPNDFVHDSNWITQ